MQSAKRAREVVFSVLRDACIDGDLSIPEAIEAVKDIFLENAKKFYKINLDVKHFDSKIGLSHNFVKAETDALQPDVALVRIIWVDASGQHRCRVVPKKRFHNTVVKNGVGLTFACMAMSSAADCPADETNLDGVGEIRLMPDLSTKWTIPWLKQEEMVLADMHLKPGEAWEYCPREALRRISKVLKDEFNLVMNAGFESEFYLLKSVLREGKEEWIPFDTTPYCSTSAFDAASPILHEVFSALQSLNIPVEQIHAEAGNGQFEIAMGYTICTNAADNLVFSREVVRAVARKHGLLATFVPKYALDDIGSGSHVHLSLWENGKNVFMASDGYSLHGMSKVGEEFMAGVLKHLPSLLAFTAPVPNSYDRIQPNTWSGAYQCWGKDNREAPLRTASPPGVPNGIVSNFEIKAFDGCANPYLGLASVIAAGIDGLRSHLTLPEPIDQNPSILDSKLQRLPTSLSESVDALDKDNFLKDLIGEKLLVAIKGVRKAEIAYYTQNKDAYKQLIYRY
ncbi:glutamine synthetase [Sarracenia purpurea var. burkii]